MTKKLKYELADIHMKLGVLANNLNLLSCGAAEHTSRINGLMTLTAGLQDTILDLYDKTDLTKRVLKSTLEELAETEERPAPVDPYEILTRIRTAYSNRAPRHGGDQ